MPGLQPLLHDLVCTFTAPYQFWSEPNGDAHERGVQGAFMGDTRILRRAVLRSESHTLEPVRIAPFAADRHWVDLVVRQPEAHVDPLVLARRERVVSEGQIREEIVFRNGSEMDENVQLRLELVPDASPMEVVKQGLPPLGVEALDAANPTWHARHVEVSLEHDGEAEIKDGSLVVSWDLLVRAGESARATWTLTARAEDGSEAVGAPSERFLMGEASGLVSRAAGNTGLERFLTTSLADLDSLLMAPTDAPDDAFLAAGAPWFFTLFGRDSLISASFLLPVTPRLAAGTLRTLAARQATERQPLTAAQPGKILHEVRREEIEVTTPDGTIRIPPLYYGTIDATALWISLLHDAWRAGMPEAEVRELLPNLRAALAWMRDYGDADGDGFLEYFDEAGTGLANQGWKDSGDSVRWRDGSLAEGPIALAEVQGYAHRAALDGADLLEAFGGEPTADGMSRADEAAGWREWAAGLAERFRAAFWLRDAVGPYPAIALDAEKRPVDSVTSNMGHLLASGMLDDGEMDAIVARLTSPSMLSGYGIRTAASTELAYHPLRYHVGSVWPHDTAMAIDGMLRAGYPEEAEKVARCVLRAAEAFHFRLPELFGGDSAADAPLPYPAACRPQAWAAASSVVVARALLGA